MNRVRDETSLTSTIVQAKRYINIALRDMHVGYRDRFPWSERTGYIYTHPTYATGTVSVSSGSTTVTGSGTAWATDSTTPSDTTGATFYDNVVAGGVISFGGDRAPYVVDSVTNDTSLELERA